VQNRADGKDPAGAYTGRPRRDRPGCWSRPWGRRKRAPPRSSH